MKHKPHTFYCFSPPVMLATFVVEIALLVYVLVRYRMTSVVRLASLILAMLAVFQLAEYNICSSNGASSILWSRVGFVAITLLPVLGLHMVQLIARRNYRLLTWFAYGAALVWILIFVASDWAFLGQACSGNYVTFQLRSQASILYSAYYYVWLAVALGLSYSLARRAKGRIRRALSWFAVGYLVFLVPTGVVNLLRPETTAGIPSIMCGFAVFYALILVFAILPLGAKRR